MAMVNALEAQAFLVRHNVTATFTPEGLTAIGSWLVGNMVDPDDIIMEEPYAFPIDEGGMVDIKPIKQWLGY